MATPGKSPRSSTIRLRLVLMLSQTIACFLTFYGLGIPPQMVKDATWDWGFAAILAAIAVALLACIWVLSGISAAKIAGKSGRGVGRGR